MSSPPRPVSSETLDQELSPVSDTPCVHYKFSSLLRSDSVSFSGPCIRVGELKRNIMTRMRLNPSHSELLITDAQTEKEYTEDEDQIPKHSSVIVRRTPVGGVIPAGRTFTVVRSLAAVLESSRPTDSSPQVTPPELLAEDEKRDDPPSAAGLIPTELLCPICKTLLRDAAITPCCGNSYCDDCIRASLLDSEGFVCFACKQSDVSPDSLVANKLLRKAVDNFENGTGYTKYGCKKLQSADPTLIANLVDANTSEEEQIQLMMLISNFDYDPLYNSKRAVGPPPAHYTCCRCGQNRHYVHRCPMMQDKSAGGPRPGRLSKGVHQSFMVEAEQRKVNAKGRTERPPSEPEDESSSEESTPAVLLCPICNDLLLDDSFTSCCRKSFRYDCNFALIQN